MFMWQRDADFRAAFFDTPCAALAGDAMGAAQVNLFYDQIFAIVRRPFDLVVEEARAQGQIITLAVSGVTDAFTLQLQVVLISGVVLSLPIWLYQLWRFLAPGMKSNERRWAIVFAAVATPLFLFGAWVAYQTMPNLLHLLLGFTPQGVANIINVNEYLGFIIQILLFFGIGALIPLIFVMLNFAGFLTARGLLRQWRWLVIGVLTFAAVATPTADPFTMLMVAGPFLAIVVVAVLVMWLNDARRARTRGADPLANLSDDQASPTPEPVVHVDDLRPSRIDGDAT